MLKINVDLCKGCGYCIKFCPKSVLTMGRERNNKGHFFPLADEEKCISCAICATMCPEAAIELVKEDAE